MNLSLTYSVKERSLNSSVPCRPMYVTLMALQSAYKLRLIHFTPAQWCHPLQPHCSGSHALSRQPRHKLFGSRQDPLI